MQGSGLRRELGVIIVAIRRSDGHMLFDPAGEERLAAHDVLIVLGRRPQLDRREKPAGPA